MRTKDLFMMQAMNGQERDIEQWRHLLKDADERLEIVAVRTPEGSGLSIIEVRLVLQDHIQDCIGGEDVQIRDGIANHKTAGMNVNVGEVAEVENASIGCPPASRRCQSG